MKKYVSFLVCLILVMIFILISPLSTQAENFDFELLSGNSVSGSIILERPVSSLTIDELLEVLKSEEKEEDQALVKRSTGSFVTFSLPRMGQLDDISQISEKINIQEKALAGTLQTDSARFPQTYKKLTEYLNRFNNCNVRTVFNDKFKCRVVGNELVCTGGEILKDMIVCDGGM